MIDVLMSSFVGHTPPRIVQVMTRHLNTAIPGVLDKYVASLEVGGSLHTPPPDRMPGGRKLEPDEGTDQIQGK